MVWEEGTSKESMTWWQSQVDDYPCCGAWVEGLRVSGFGFVDGNGVLTVVVFEHCFLDALFW